MLFRSEPDQGSESDFQRQTDADAANPIQSTGCNWVETGADRPGAWLPYNLIKYHKDTFDGYIPIKRRDTICFMNPEPKTERTSGLMDLKIEAIDTFTFTVRMLVPNIIIPFGNSNKAIINLNTDEIFRINLNFPSTSANVNGFSPLKSRPFRLGNRSPDNICLYGGESPVFGLDYFPGDILGDKRDENGELRKK